MMARVVLMVMKMRLIMIMTPTKLHTRTLINWDSNADVVDGDNGVMVIMTVFAKLIKAGK